MSDIVRLPNGQTVTRSLARSRGWVDAQGNLTNKAPRPSAEQDAITRRTRQAEWRKRQGLDEPEAPEGLEPPVTDDEQAALEGTTVRPPKPQTPQNVTADGEPITDPDLLAEIAARTAAIDAAKAVE